MPLDDFVSEVMEILRTRPAVTEIQVQRVEFLRYGEARGDYQEVVRVLNESDPHGRGSGRRNGVEHVPNVASSPHIHGAESGKEPVASVERNSRGREKPANSSSRQPAPFRSGVTTGGRYRARLIPAAAIRRISRRRISG
ncbi:hypothetical protein [Flexivirga lutea]